MAADASNTASNADSDAAANDAQGWDAVEGAGEPAEVLEITDTRIMKEATHPMRGRILRRFKHPHTVAEVAEALGVPVTRLYHHVNRLAEDGLIHVVATRQVAAVTERRYQVTARSFRLADSLFDTLDRHELALAMASVFDLAKFELMRLVETGGLEQIEQSRDESVISLGELHLTAERRAELVERLNSLFEEFRPAGTAEGGDTAPYNLFIAGFPEARPD